jgi:hypothetical protein
MSNINDAANISGPAPQGLSTDPTCMRFSSGASAIVHNEIDSRICRVILNGVNATFALTFPIPKFDGQQMLLMVAASISAFSAVPQGAGVVIQGVPASPAANSGYGWYYRAIDATWYRQY